MAIPKKAYKDQLYLFRRQKTEDRRQKTEDRRQKDYARLLRTDVKPF